MSKEYKDTVIIFSKNFATRSLFKKISIKYLPYRFLFISDIKHLGNDRNEIIIPHIIFLDRFNEANTPAYKNSVVESIRKENSYFRNVPIVLILDKESMDSEKDLQKLFKNGIDFILYKPIDEFLLQCLLYRYLLKVKDMTEIYKYHDIELDRNRRVAYFKKCKIELNHLETVILYLLISTEKEFTPQELCNHILKEESKSISENHLRVTITRLRSKFRKVSDLNIIKSKKDRGYYISI